MFEFRTLKALWDNAQASYGDAPALSVFKKDSFSYREAGDLGRGVQMWLQSQGVKQGDKVALIAENSPWWGISYLAVVSMGAVVVPIMIDFSSEQIQNILDHSDAKALITSPRGVIGVASHALLDGKTLVINKGLYVFTGAPLAAGETRDKAAVLELLGDKINPVAKDALSSDLVEVLVDEQDIAAIIYTSGTTGASKGVMLTHLNLAHNAFCGIAVGRMTHGERVRMLSLLPLAHAYECTIGFLLPMLVGAEVVYLEGPPSPRLLLPALREVRPHYVLAVPLLIEKIYKSRILPKVQEKKLLAWLYSKSCGRKLINRFILGKALKNTFGGRVRRGTA